MRDKILCFSQASIGGTSSPVFISHWFTSTNFRNQVKHKNVISYPLTVASFPMPTIFIFYLLRHLVYNIDCNCCKVRYWESAIGSVEAINYFPGIILRKLASSGWPSVGLQKARWWLILGSQSAWTRCWRF